MKSLHILVLLTITFSVGTTFAGNKEKKGVLPMETITLGSGCFWCVEAIFEEVRGVKSVSSGYSGGEKPNPSYKAICTGTTGHAEVCQVIFDPEIVSVEDILEIFFKSHDPTTLNRQGADVGTQYRSIIFYHNESQREKANAILNKLNQADIWPNPIVTTIEPFTAFYIAENVHQNYYTNNKAQPYCRAVITPKVVKFRKLFENLRKK